MTALFQPTPSSMPADETPVVGLIPVAAPSYQGLVYRISSDQNEILNHDEARLFPSADAAIKHLQKTPCPPGLQKVFPLNEAPNLSDLYWSFGSYGQRQKVWCIADAPVATSSFDSEQDLQNALAVCGGTIKFTSRWEAETTAQKFRDLCVYKKGSDTITRRLVKFTSKSRRTKHADPITNAEDSGVSFNFKNPRHLYLLPVHTAFLNALHACLTTPPTTQLNCGHYNEAFKWDGFDLDHWDGTSPPRPWSKEVTYYLADHSGLPSHPTADPTLADLAKLSEKWCTKITTYLTSLRTPSRISEHCSYGNGDADKTGPFRTPLVYLNRHRRTEALTSLSLYRPHLLNLQTYPPACDRLPESSRNRIATAHFNLSVSLASFALALRSRTFPDLPCAHLLPVPKESSQ